MPSNIIAKYSLIFTCFFFTIFSLSLIHPINQKFERYAASTWGKLPRHVERVWNFAYADAQKPFSEVKDHWLYHQRNPGLFKFIAELSARAGAKSPIPLQLLLILLVNVGIIVQAKWLRAYFQNDIFPIVGNLFIICTHFISHFGATIHQKPYNFAFFNFTMYFMVKHVQTKQIKYFIYTWLCYLMLTQNYYMYWVSGFVMLVGINYFAGVKIISFKNFILGLAPVCTAIFLLWNIAYTHGSFEAGFPKLKQIYKARVLGIIEEPGQGQQEMTKKDYVRYPLTVSSRISRFYHINGFLFIFLGWILLRLRKANQSKLNYKFFYFLIPAGLSWYLLVYEHTDVHQVAGRYSFFLWMIFFGYYFSEMHQWILNKGGNYKRQFLKYNWPFLLIYGVYGFGYIHLYHLIGNIWRIVG